MVSDRRLETEPVGKLFVSLAVPSIISQIVNLLYSVVDRMYVGHISGTGTLGLTALGVCVPVITLVSSFAQLVSSGAAPLASIRMGGGQKEQAEQILGNSFSAMLIMSVLLTAVLLIFTEPILILFGASEATMPYAAAPLCQVHDKKIFIFSCPHDPAFLIGILPPPVSVRRQKKHEVVPFLPAAYSQKLCCLFCNKTQSA